MSNEMVAFLNARLDEDEAEAAAADQPPAFPAVSFGIAEAAFNEWEVHEHHRGFFHRTVGSGLPKREAQLVRDKHRAALYSDHPDYREEWKP